VSDQPKVSCVERDEDHCTHWQEGDGDCCHCGEPNWSRCEDEAEYIPEGKL